MTKKADFNAEEWALVAEGPPIAGLITLSAQRGGSFREAMEMAKVYAEGSSHKGDSELINDLVCEKSEVEPTRYKSKEDLREQGLQRIGRAIDVLEEKALPEEVDAYRHFTIQLAERVARAHREGGKEVSESESAALDEIAAALGTSPTDAAA